MKTAPRFLSAAFAITAIAAMPFAAPAQTAEAGNRAPVADLHIGLTWAGASKPDGSKKTELMIYNYSQGDSGRIVAATFCGYKLPNGPTKEIAAQKVESLAPLAAGYAKPYEFWCPSYMGFSPSYSRLEIRGENETNMANNKLQTTLEYPHGA